MLARARKLKGRYAGVQHFRAAEEDILDQPLNQEPSKRQKQLVFIDEQPIQKGKEV